MSTNGGSSTRSPSPASSESLSDDHANSATVDFSAWCHFPPDPLSESEATSLSTDDKEEIPKIGEESLRMLEEILKVQAYNPISPESPTAINPAIIQLSQPQQENKTSSNSREFLNFSSDNSSSESAPVGDLIPRTVSTTAFPTRVIPPPPVQPRRIDNSMHHRVIFPARESCYNLAILTPNIPLTGTKSRVETQVRVALDLALPSGSSGDPRFYDKVGSWKWLKLPKGTATRKRSRKEGKIDASPIDTLFLDAEVTCASYPSKQVLSCSTCQGREAKRVARKIAARVRPARSDSDSNEGDGDSSSKIVQFNCPDTLDFSSGSVVLPLRITCYCRHHREKVGFNVHFTMRDASGRLVSRGMSPPIMITDDHKSTDKNACKQSSIPPYVAESEWEHRAPLSPSPCEPVSASTGASSRRRHPATKDGPTMSKRRPKPYDNERMSSARMRRGDPLEGRTQPTVNTTMSSTVPGMDSEAAMITPFSPFAPSMFTNSGPTSPISQRRDSVMALPSPSNSNQSSVSPQTAFMETSDSIMNEILGQPYSFFPLSPPETAPSSPPSHDATASSSPTDLPNLFNMLHPSPDPSLLSLPSPKIHRLIPSSGPTFGGIEVTVLGSNFHPSVLHNCVFGDVVSSSTTRWSDNTLVCILPPRATPGVVPVTLDGLKVDTGGAPALFTYVDETDRTLMELALQVVGLKMTGKIEDAKDIAMRIVGSSQDSQNRTGNTQMMNLANSALPDSRRLFFGRSDDVEFEKTIMDSLTSLDMRGSSGERLSVSSVISHPTKTGQTLLHLAASLNFPSLVEFLIQHDISLDAQDINGYTALHSAVLHGSQCCARQIINAGADTSIYTKMGYTASELAPEGFFTPVRAFNEAASENSDDESHFGDVDEDSEVESRPNSRMHARRRVRHPRSRRSSVPASVVSDASDVEKGSDAHATAEDDDNATVVSPDGLCLPGAPEKDTTIDEKQAASFAEYLQRVWAQLHPPHLRAQMPQLPGMPGWVFPVFVPMQAWPPFRTGRHVEESDEKEAMNYDRLHTPRASWDKWMTAENSAGMSHQDHHDDGNFGSEPDMKPTSTKSDSDEVPELATPTPATSRSILRRFRYDRRQMQVSEKEIREYAYRPKARTLMRNVKKDDRMLFFFWIPILILALGWALYASHPAITMMKEYMPWEDIVGCVKAVV